MGGGKWYSRDQMVWVGEMRSIKVTVLISGINLAFGSIV